jgi:DNA polymerase III subunit delta'
MFTTPLGHTAAQTQITQLLASGRMPHAILLAGPQGIGKATLANYLAARLICGSAGQGLQPDTSAPQYAQLQAGSCPDYHLLTPPEGKKSIGIDAVRSLLATLKRTADTNRVIVIDAVDDMTTEAANTLLKTLEEPRPGIYFILVCHRLGQALATIRSRCRLMLLSPLSESDTKKILLANGADADALESLIRQAQGCPGQILIPVTAQEELLRSLAATRTFASAQSYQKALRHMATAKEVNLPQTDSLTYLKSLTN